MKKSKSQQPQQVQAGRQTYTSRISYSVSKRTRDVLVQIHGEEAGIAVVEGGGQILSR